MQCFFIKLYACLLYHNEQIKSIFSIVATLDTIQYKFKNKVIMEVLESL